jgi:hypothetical protein
MRKYQCNACGIHICTAEYQGGGDVPFKCTGINNVYYKPQWKEVAELPKLTAKVFNRPDCPAWAQYAAVDINGIACFYDKKPKCDNIQLWLSGENGEHFMVIRRKKYDASDWQNSLIERPAPVPEWCKIGGFVYLKALQIYKKIESAEELNHISEQGYWKSCCQARLRPYNADEMKELVGKVYESSVCTFLITGYDKRSNSVKVNEVWFDAKDLMNGKNSINPPLVDGKPCGVLEHIENGEWVR